MAIPLLKPWINQVASVCPHWTLVNTDVSSFTENILICSSAGSANRKGMCNGKARSPVLTAQSLWDFYGSPASLASRKLQFVVFRAQMMPVWERAIAKVQRYAVVVAGYIYFLLRKPHGVPTDGLCTRRLDSRKNESNKELTQAGRLTRVDHPF